MDTREHKYGLRFESFVANNPSEIVWLRLERLRSTNLCKKLISKKKGGLDLSSQLAEKKAVGVASAIDNAISYWKTKTDNLSAKILLRYYGLLQFTIAEQVSSTDNQDDLASIQKHTEMGHGLGQLIDESEDFANGVKIFAIKGGHFWSYYKHRGFKRFGKMFFEKRVRKVSELGSHNVNAWHSLTSLLRRVPELHNTIHEYTGKPTLALPISHSSYNMKLDTKIMDEQMYQGNFSLNPQPQGPLKDTWISISLYDQSLSIDYLKTLKLPLEDLRIIEGGKYDSPTIDGRLQHSSEKNWYECIQTYRSDYCGTVYMVPFFGGTQDVVLLHLAKLYSLSIIVRYMPELWNRITSGDLNQYLHLLDFYLSILDNVLPHICLEQITEKKIDIQQPGSLFAPV